MNQTKLALLIAIASLGVTLSPLPKNMRLITGITGGGLALFQGVEERSKRLRKEAATDAKRKLSTIGSIRLAQDLEALELAESQLNLQKAHQIQELKMLEEMLLQEIEAKERQSTARLEELAIASNYQLQQVNKTQLEEQEQKLQKLRDELEEQEQAKEERKIAQAKELEELAREASVAIVKKKAAQVKELEDAEDALLERFQEEQSKMLAELTDLKRNLEKEATQKYEAWLIPHAQEMDAKIREIEALRGTVEMLQQQIAQDTTIKLCPEHGTAHGDRANVILLWLREWGVYANFVSASFAPDESFILNFLPWIIGSKAEKAIKGLLLSMQSHFGLSEPPSFQPNGAARAWSLVFFPAKRAAIALQDFYSKVPDELNVTALFSDIEPAIRDGVAQQLNYQQQVEEMLVFRPPTPLPLPRTRQITQIEIDCARWLFSWRSLAGEGENITTRKGLLFFMYGKREGGASSNYNSCLGESLGDRVKRILDILRVEAVKLEELEEVEND